MKKKENENMKKKILALALAGVLVVGALTGCVHQRVKVQKRKLMTKRLQ